MKMKEIFKVAAVSCGWLIVILAIVAGLLGACLMAATIMLKIAVATNMMGPIVIGSALMIWLKLDEINTKLKGKDDEH